MSEKNKKSNGGKPFFKRMISRLIVRSVNRIDFLKMAKKIAGSEVGRPFYEKFKKIPEDWRNSREISDLTVDLTIDQVEKEGGAADREEIEGLIREIEIRYSRTVHENAAASIGTLFDHLFDHQNSELPFTSQDGRDLKNIEKLRAFREQGHGVVYLINHSSHLDEFILDLLWQNLNMGLPVFAAGQNMMAVKSIATLLMVGSYVVLRQGASRYQMAALYNYCRAISMSGAQQGIFLEAWRGGARTRDGSLRYPKRLVTLRGAIDLERELVVQPVAISYNAVPEDLMMCSRKSAKSWVRGMGVFKAMFGFPLTPRAFLWRAAENLYGRAYVSVPPPMLLSQLKEGHGNDKSGISLDEFVALSSIKEIARCKKVMTSQLTARAIVHARRKGGDLSGGVKEEMAAMKQYHLNIFNEEPDFEDFIREHSIDEVITDGLKTLKKRGVLKRFSKDENNLPVVKDEVALSYYATHGDRRLYSPTADQNIVVVGAGNWGFAIASLVGNRLLEDKRYNTASITIFDSRPDIVEHMGITRVGTGRFSEKVLPKNVFVTGDFQSAFRRASEIIIASKPENFEAHMRGILEVSEQPFKIMVATRGFVPEKQTLPYHAVEGLLKTYGREDVDLYTIAGPVDPHDLVETKFINGILAGPESGMDNLADLFQRSSGRSFLSCDPIGVQIADIMARVYAVWVNYMDSSKQLKHESELGYLVSAVSDEARTFALALGASPDTFTAGSIPWTATFTCVNVGGPWKEFGVKLGNAVRKGKKPEVAFKKLNRQWIDDGRKLQALTDINEAMICSKKLGLDLPILKEASETFLGYEDVNNIP